MPPPVVRVPKYIGRGAFLDVPAYATNASMALVVNGTGDGFSYVSVALASHAHDAADITSGTIADARIASTITRDNEVMPIVLAADGSGSGLDADLLRGVTPSAYGLTLIDDADAATARGTLGLGALATAGVPGSTTQVIYNSAGALAGDAGMTYDAANDALTVAGRVVTPVIRPPSDSTTALKFKTAGDVDFVTLDTTNRRFGIKCTPAVALQVVGDLRVGASTSSYFSIVQTNTDQYGWLSAPGGVYFVKFNTGSGTGRSGNASFGDAGNSPTAWVDITASNTAGASLRLRSGADPTAPNDGDIWYNSRLKFYRSTTTEIFATGVQATGGVATAAATYGSNEQSMLQKVYDAARAFGLLS